MKFKLYVLPLLFFPIISVYVGVIYKINFLTSIIFFFVIPSFYLSFLLGKKSLKVLLLSINSIFATVIIDRLATLNKTWAVVSIFNYQIVHVPVEQFIWGFFFVYMVVAFYEVFFPQESGNIIKNKIYYLTAFMILLFLIITYSNGALIYLSRLSKLYIFGGITIFIVPIILVSIKFPKTKKSLLLTGLFFFFLTILYEFTALKNSLWSFPGSSTAYLYVININGLRLPLEEFIYFSILGSSGVLSYYLLFYLPKDTSS